MIRVLKAERFQIVSGGAEPLLPFAYEPFFFHHPAYIAFQPPEGLQVFYLLDQVEQTVIAHLPVWIKGEKAVSPLRGTFGSVQMKAGLSPEVLNHFLKFCIRELERQHIQQIELRHYPASYSPENSAVCVDALLRTGFTVSQSQLSHYLDLEIPFENALHLSAKRRLQKCRKAGFRFQKEDLNQLDSIYNFVDQCREEQGKQLSLTKEQLQKLVMAFPDRYLLFSVKDNEKIVAATVAVRISADVLYNFYPSSLRSYNQFSPSVLLHAGLHGFAKSEGFKIIDLGISSLPENPYYSLMEFKAHLGGIPSLKFAFSWRKTD